MSKALHGDDPSLYTVIYRDLRENVEVSLLEFLAISEDFTRIPASRILEIKRRGVMVFARGGSRTRKSLDGH